MQSAIRKALAITAMIAGALLTPTAVKADDAPFVVVNAASFQDGPVSTGALLAIYTDERVSPEESWTYLPWTTTPHHGLRIEASCANHDAFLTLPVQYVGFAYGGNQINVYKPNWIGSEPWGSCPYTGWTMIRIHGANGAYAEGEVMLLPAHPGIFMEGQAPAGDHVDKDGNHMALSSCPSQIQLNPKACTVRAGSTPSELWVFLTGAEWFLCGDPGDLCDTDEIMFELGPSPTAPESSWVRQTLRVLEVSPTGTGVERAMIRLEPDTPAGVYYLRVRNDFRPEYPTPLRVELGQPS